MTSRHKESEKDVERDFASRELADWLETGESRSVGWHHEGESESVGHHSGRRIIEIKRTRGRASEDVLAHMRKVVSDIKRHLAQRPDHDVEHVRWRYSLMNWGHDPLKDR